ncbi:MAG: nucleotide exchange factor GrpE, partial [Desulfobacterales bacterium]
MREKKHKPQSGKSGQPDTAEEPKAEVSREINKTAAQDESVEERLKAAEAKAEENHDRLLRVTAEFENYKKRMERDMNDFKKFANESLIKDILPIVDNLERALEIPKGDNEKTFDGLRKGVEMTLKGLMDGLKKFGVVQIESFEKPFDPNLHQAVMTEESDKHSESTVSQVLQKGY